MRGAEGLFIKMESWRGVDDWGEGGGRAERRHGVRVCVEGETIAGRGAEERRKKGGGMREREVFGERLRCA